MKTEIQEQVIPEEVQELTPETKKVESSGQEPSGRSNTQEDDEGQVELLTFSLGTEEFSFKVAEVQEILRIQKMTKIPTMQNYVIGITSLRGNIIPVLDLEARLNLKNTGEAPEYGTEENPGVNRESENTYHRRHIGVVSRPNPSYGHQAVTLKGGSEVRGIDR